MSRRLLIFPLLLASCFWQSETAPLAQRVKKREQPTFSRGGPFDLGFDHGRGRVTELLRAAEARAFLWENWRLKRRAHCVVITRTIEGDPTTVNYYVQPDAKGRWHIRGESESWCCWFYAAEGKTAEKRSGSTTYYGVRRIDATTGQTLPDAPWLRPDTYSLILAPAPGKGGPKPSDTIL